VRVKICGITQVDQGVAIARLGATALGFICVPTSPRYVTRDQIQAITKALEENQLTCDRIGVFADAPLAVIQETAAIARLTGVQLHSQETPAFCAQVQEALPTVEVIKALKVRTTAPLDQVMAYEETVAALLLDAYHPTLLGGTGQTLAWRYLQGFRPACPWFLAGGLTPDNIRQALVQIQPDGLDLSSGVERSPGDKDLVQVARLFQELEAAG